ALLGGGLSARPGGVHPATGARRPGRLGADRLDHPGEGCAAVLPLVRAHPGATGLLAGQGRRGPDAAAPAPGRSGRHGLDLVTNRQRSWELGTKSVATPQSRRVSSRSRRIAASVVSVLALSLPVAAVGSISA